MIKNHRYSVVHCTPAHTEESCGGPDAFHAHLQCPTNVSVRVIIGAEIHQLVDPMLLHGDFGIRRGKRTTNKKDETRLFTTQPTSSMANPVCITAWARFIHRRSTN